jgi:1-acyl-sn-glycerol-3-phosphate acyltransferase
LSSLIPDDRITLPLDRIGLFNRLFYRMQRWVGLSLLKLLFRFRVHGKYSLGQGPLIVAANHESLLDPVVLQAALDRRVHFLMTSDYYFKPVLNRYSRIMRCIPVMEGRFNREAIRSAVAVLAAGRPVAIFPQGEIRNEGDLSSPMRGMALLAAKSNAPVLPVRISGTGKAWPKGARFLRLASIEVRLGRPLTLGAFRTHPPQPFRQDLEAFTHAVMQAMSQL